jgi:catechol 2,3-dioxygenase-like lactoylglutathione lyase family enzyme
LTGAEFIVEHKILAASLMEDGGGVHDVANAAGSGSFPSAINMRLSHINITMPKGGEETARSFYAGLFGLREIPKPESIRGRGGVWFDAGGLDIHVSVEEQRTGPDAYRHFGLESVDVEALRAKLQAAGLVTEDGRPAPWRRFFVRDPFGNRIEIHEAGGLRA